MLQRSSLPAQPNAAQRGGALRADTHGAILVIGIVLGALLTMALGHLVGLSKAILWREAAQNAADAAAFEHAAWQARGMNLLAGVNIVMSLLVAALVLWRLAATAAIFATLLGVTLTLLEPKANVGEQGARGESLLAALAADARVAKEVSSLLAGLSAAQTAIATYTPILATRASVLDTARSYGVATGTFSASLLPTSNPQRAQELTRCSVEGHVRRSAERGSERVARDVVALSRAGGERPPLTRKLGMPFSLPVEAEDYSLLCRAAGDPGKVEAEPIAQALSGRSRDFLVDNAGRHRALTALGLSSSAARTLDIVRELSALLGGRADALFCAAHGPARRELVAVAARLARHFQAQERRAEPSDDEPALLLTLADAQRAFAALDDAWRREPSDAACSQPAKVWAAAKNGNVHFRSTALVAPFARAEEKTNAGVWAHAETYFDCADRWERCAPNALWQLRWSSRLRRVQPFAALLEAGGVKWTRGERLASESAVREWLGLGARRLGQSSEFATALVRGFVPGLAARRVQQTPAFASEQALFRRRPSALAELIQAARAAQAEIH